MQREKNGEVHDRTFLKNFFGFGDTEKKLHINEGKKSTRKRNYADAVINGIDGADRKSSKRDISWYVLQ